MKIELSGKQGKTMISPWTGVRVSKGNESYTLQVIHRPSDDPLALVKTGQFNVTGTPVRETGCRHTWTFKLYTPNAGAPCRASSGPSGGAPAVR